MDQTQGRDSDDSASAGHGAVVHQLCPSRGRAMPETLGDELSRTHGRRRTLQLQSHMDRQPRGQTMRRPLEVFVHETTVQKKIDRTALRDAEDIT